MAKINYESEIANLERIVSALQQDIDSDALSLRIVALEQTIIKTNETITLLKQQRARLPSELIAAQERLKAMRKESLMVNNKQLQELLKLRAKLEAKIAKVTKAR